MPDTMPDRVIADFTGPDEVSLTCCRSGVTEQSGPFAFVSPVGPQDRQHLRWYVEDRPDRPSGGDAARAELVERRLADLGHQLYEALLGHERATAARALAGTADCEFVVRSDDVNVLDLPWELLRAPEADVPLATAARGVTRCLPGAELDEVALPAERLRLLLVIGRPAGTADVRYRSIAKPLQECVGRVSTPVELTVLRPPTLRALEQRLTEAREEGRPFSVLHFDVHGELTADGGTLLLETDRGGPHRVAVERLAHVVAASAVPVVVLNACESGAVGAQLETSLAARLSLEGTPSVVAMGYRMKVTAAAEFTASFYEGLLAGDDVTLAVRAGRRRLWEDAASRHGESPPSPPPAGNWLVPVHYLRREARFPKLPEGRQPSVRREPSAGREPSARREPSVRREPSRRHAGSGPPPGEDPLIGRDDLFLSLELAARRHRVLLLHGMGGIGKSAVATAFSRWWRDTGGVDDPRWVVETSFTRGPQGFRDLLDHIGRRIDLSAPGSSTREQWHAHVRGLLLTRRILLVWDGFETVGTMPTPDTVWPEADRRHLAALVRDIADEGRSTVLITSRTNETWLGDIRRVRVPALPDDEARQYIRSLDDGRTPPKEADVVERELAGHPLALREIRPLLTTAEPWAVLELLRGEAPRSQPRLPPALTADVAHSFRHLPADVARFLTAVCLLPRTVRAEVLTRLSAAPSGRFAGVTAATWADVLERAAAVGLLEDLGGDRYAKHPALSAFLAERWRAETGDDHRFRVEREQAIRELAQHEPNPAARFLGESGASTGHALIDDQVAMVGMRQSFSVLRELRLWSGAEAELLPLSAFFDRTGLTGSIFGMAARFRARLDGTEPDTTLTWPFRPGGLDGMVWFVVRHHFTPAPHETRALLRACRKVVRLLERQPVSPRRQRRLLSVHHELARISRQGANLTDAEQHARRALALADDPGTWTDQDEDVLPSSFAEPFVFAEEQSIRYEILGDLSVIASRQERWDVADAYLRQALAMAESVGDPRDIATALADLGSVTLRKGDLRGARRWYVRALARHAEYGARDRMAEIYGNLGDIASVELRLADAEDWYRRARGVLEQVNSPRATALNNFRLGEVCRDRGRLTEAEAWYRQALEGFRSLNDGYRTAMVHGALGRTAFDLGDLDGARVRHKRAYELFRRLGRRAEAEESRAELRRLARLDG
jgi:tetratricopeptide (TPR) repeat protein